ncbi:MAG: HigA family addiction module antitoxin [Granulosicoccaceae bacterium]
MSNSPKSGVQSIDASQVKKWLDQDKIVLVDVRETSEYDQEHIPGSMLLPLSKFDPEIFPTVPGKMIVLHCAVGKRSESAGKMLISEGHTGAVHLTGGIEAWKAAGYATEIQITPPPSPSELKAQQPVYLCPPPGNVLNEEYLEPLSIAPEELAKHIGMVDTDMAKLINGELSVNVEMSLRLARYFSTAADFWVHLQLEHDLELARHQFGAQIKREITPRTATE